jgi:hypothetical protein
MLNFKIMLLDLICGAIFTTDYTDPPEADKFARICLSTRLECISWSKDKYLFTKKMNIPDKVLDVPGVIMKGQKQENI